MTQVLQLTNLSGSVILDLLQGPFRLTAGFDFATPGQGGVFVYEPYGAQFDFGNFQPHTETFSLGIRGQRATVISAMNDLQDFLEMVRLFNDGDLAAESCWLKWAADGEEEKWSLLYGGTFKVLSQDNVTPGLGECVVTGALSLTRHPLWESPIYKTSGPIIPSLDTVGGNQIYLNFPGNTLGRIWLADISTDTVGAVLYRGWIGIRRENQGLTSFNPLWECEDGTNIAADTTDAPVGPPDPTASGGLYVATTFAVGGLVERFHITVGDVTAVDYDHFQGRYLVLARCKVVGGGGVAGIQMHYGYTGNQIAEEVYIDNTDWRLIPLGNISIPPWKGPEYAFDPFYVNYRIDIWAEELVTCDLDMDCFILIPNEHMLTFDGADINEDEGGALQVRVHADDTDSACSYEIVAQEVTDSVEYTLTDWYAPPGNAIVVVGAERQTSSVLADDITMTSGTYPRWTLYRGE